MISKYIKELVEDNNNRIIVPDFGAFMIQNTPNGKQISFNDFLKFNDGLLINQIIKAEKITKAEATEKIKSFIKDVEKQFADKKSFEIKDVGFLTRDDQNNIKFEGKLAAAAKTSAPKTEPTKASTAKTEPVKTEPAKPATGKVEIPKTRKNIAIPKEPLSNKKDDKPESQSASKTTKVVIPPTTKTQSANKPNNASKSATSKTTANKGNDKLPIAKEGNNMMIVFIIVGVVLLLGILTLVEYKWSIIGIFGDDKNTVEVQPTITKPEPVAVPDSIMAQDTIKEEVVEEEKVVEEKPQIDPNAKRYYLVAGSFRIKSNADRFNQKLISEGYSSEIINRSSGFYTVSYKTFYNWNEALSEMKSMRASQDPQAWILVK